MLQLRLCFLPVLVLVVENLRVAASAIMLDCVRARTNLSTRAIGERVADSIIET